MISPKYTVLGLLIAVTLGLSARAEFEVDTLPTSQGDLQITFVGHGTLMFKCGDTIVHVDPVGRYADYSKMPKADIILVTHEHGDHLDKDAITKIATDDTIVLLTATCRQQGQSGEVMKNGDVKTIKGLQIEAVPAYNLVHMRGPGKPFHPKGTGNGYVIGFGGKRIYVGGDTEDIPEMAQLAGVDIAFLPMNLPYTMTPEMVAHAAGMLQPKILYPYHFGRTDTSQLIELMKDCEGIEVRIRKLQ